MFTNVKDVDTNGQLDKEGITMSVIVAIKKDGKVYIGADSQVTRGGCRFLLTNPNNYKIWKVKGVDNCIMGSVGNLRDACAIRVMHNLIREIDVLHDDVDFDYVVNRIEPMIRDELKEHEFIDSSNPYKSMESRFILAYKDKLFTIDYGAVVEHDNFIAIGSGDCQAIGSLVSTIGDECPEERIIKALKSGVTNDLYIDYPFIITNTETTEFDVITENDEKTYVKYVSKADSEKLLVTSK